ncbi:MerR family transcriptional regulator [Micromonospora sp. NPDC050200]|uniref:MerR family transcriptional regulator n=1 Tax=Micromonospora sp. NPDC050200 TaxID=3155664 RepID=UPI0033EE025D
MSGLRISQVASAAGVNPQTLRYYERRGLLSEPRRSLGGHRRYPAETITVLRVIKAAQRLGFTLDEVADMLAIARHRHRRSADAGLRARTPDKLAEVEAKITDLQVIAETLRAAVDAGCDDLVTCARSPCCPLPFAPLGQGTPMPTLIDLSRRLLPSGLTGLAGAACLGCCAIPLLLAADILSGAGWAALGRWMPGLTVALAAASGAAWWWARRHTRRDRRRPAGLAGLARAPGPVGVAAGIIALDAYGFVATCAWSASPSSGTPHDPAEPPDRRQCGCPGPDSPDGITRGWMRRGLSLIGDDAAA